MFTQLAALSIVLAVAAFGVGMMPLVVGFSKTHVERLSALGTGLLLGAGLGVIIPEGIENLIEANPSDEVPTSKIALSLLVGFTLMLALEQLAIPNSHHIESHHGLLATFNGTPSSQVEFDAELDDLERTSSIGNPLSTPTVLEIGGSVLNGRQRAFALTIGLVIHSLADGLALGVSSLAKTAPGATNSVTLVVFLALLLHKAPTALALTSSLLSFNLPKPDCRTYLAAFSAATPCSALISYLLLSLFGNNESNSWVGSALLLSGGSFLYVATVLQPVSHHQTNAQEMTPLSRVALIVVGMVIPFTLSSIMGHGH